MYRRSFLSSVFVILTAAALALSGCTAVTPLTPNGTAPTPRVQAEQGGADNPDVYADPAAFTEALLGAIAAGDRNKLALWMSDPFFSGAWRGAHGEQPAPAALDALFPGELGEGRVLTPAAGADLPALLGGADPLAMPGGGGVEQAVLVSGWGIDGLDDAVLFVARQTDNSLRWRGWLRVNGGFNAARFGGTQRFESETLGFRFDYPKGFTASENPDGSVSVTAPAAPGAGHPGGASIEVLPSGGRSAEQAAQQVYQETRDLLGPGANTHILLLDFDGAPAYVVVGVPSQTMQRELFVARGGQMLRMVFYPDEPDNSPLSSMQMQAVYDMIVNTFHFTS